MQQIVQKDEPKKTAAKKMKKDVQEFLNDKLLKIIHSGVGGE